MNRSNKTRHDNGRSTKIGGHLTNSIALQIGKMSPDFHACDSSSLLDQHES